MGIFSGGEKYSKEILDEAIKEEKKAKDERSSFKGTPEQYKGYSYRSGSYGETHPVSNQEVFEGVLNSYNARTKSTKERVDKLFNAGRKEAVGTNKEYDKKVLRFMEEIENFSKFAVDELGMKRGKAREIFKTIIDSVLEDIIDDVNLENAVKKENL